MFQVRVLAWVGYVCSTHCHLISLLTFRVRKLQTTARWTGNRGTTVLTESLLLPHGGAESLARCCYNNINKRFSSSWSSVVLVSIIVSDSSLLFDDVLVCLPFCWCPCMAINVSVQYDGGFLPDIILLTQCYYHRGTRLNVMKRFCIFSF